MRVAYALLLSLTLVGCPTASEAPRAVDGGIDDVLPDAGQPITGDAGLGGDAGSEDAPPSRPPVSLALGLQHTYAVLSDGSLDGWSLGVSLPPWELPEERDGGWRRVSTGELVHEVCALGNDGGVECTPGPLTCAWVIGDDPCVPPPADRSFVDIDVAGTYACGVREDGSLTCWGQVPTDFVVRDGDFVQVRLSRLTSFACGLEGGGDVVCWYTGDDGLVVQRSDGPYAHLGSVGLTVCAIYEDGSLVCPFDEREVPTGRFVDVSVGERHACAVRDDGTLVCWGDNEHRQASPPAGTFARVFAGPRHSCGARPDGSISCWGAEGTCAGSDAVSGANECGGCGPLPYAPGEACECGGALTCGGHDLEPEVRIGYRCEDGDGSPDGATELRGTDDADDDWTTVRGTLGLNDEDWYRIHVGDSWLGGFDIRAELVEGADDYGFYVYYVGDDGHTDDCAYSGYMFGRGRDYRIESTIEVDGREVSGCLGERPFEGETIAWSPGSPGASDTGTVFFRLFRDGEPLECTEYALRFKF